MNRCEYFRVDYVPALATELLLPVGLVLVDDAGRLLHAAMTRNWKIVQCLDPQADRALLGALPSWIEQITAEDRPGAGVRQTLLEMSEKDLGVVRIAPPQGVETEDPAKEFDRLFQEHVERPRPIRARTAPRVGSRRWIQARLRDALERHALWNRMRRDVPVEEFTAPGDAFRIDFAYCPNGTTRYLHALALEQDWNQAKVLSYTFGRIQAHGAATLTAIVENDRLESPTAQSCRKILSDSAIAIQPIAGLDEMLQRVRDELGPGG